MTQDELNQIIDSDSYCQQRKNPTYAEIQLYLREVNYHCPLCGKELQSRRQKKPDQRKYQIAHIYPNRITLAQYPILQGLERLGDTSESFENKIALCPDCHSTQDFQTTAEDYLNLINIKKDLLAQTALHDITIELNLESQIESVIDRLSLLSEEELSALNYDPVVVAKKFEKTELPLKTKVSGYILTYYPFIRNCFRDLDGSNGFHLQILSEQIRSCFVKMSDVTDNKTQIFNRIVEWISRKSQGHSVEACEAVTAFFVQNCEVFHEIT